MKITFNSLSFWYSGHKIDPRRASIPVPPVDEVKPFDVANPMKRSDPNGIRRGEEIFNPPRLTSLPRQQSKINIFGNPNKLWLFPRLSVNVSISKTPE